MQKLVSHLFAIFKFEYWTCRQGQVSSLQKIVIMNWNVTLPGHREHGNWTNFILF